uniref:Uncharacterized protein n=1 Tax=Manihot esculenta TaxID=3983 RepID=A0A2C9UM61_MANES
MCEIFPLFLHTTGGLTFMILFMNVHFINMYFWYLHSIFCLNLCVRVSFLLL